MCFLNKHHTQITSFCQFMAMLALSTLSKSLDYERHFYQISQLIHLEKCNETFYGIFQWKQDKSQGYKNNLSSMA